MTPSARITVTTGPDRGKHFDLSEELNFVGTSSENQVVLSDQTLQARQASIVRRNGRHAIQALPQADIEVDGTKLPTEQWVWLPATAQIRLSRRTAVEFVALEGGQTGEASAAASPGDSAPPAAPETGSSGTGIGTRKKSRKSGGASGDKRGAQVARFITDQAGDTLVKLGEDGHYPELQLQAGEHKAAVESEKKETNPALLIGGFVLSAGLTLAMLFIDVEGLGSSQARRQAVARKAITAYFQGESNNLELYQTRLRRARQAYSQGNADLERQQYRLVLELLRAENKNPFIGLTRLTPQGRDLLNSLTIDELKLLGDDFWEMKDDQKLERLIGILLER